MGVGEEDSIEAAAAARKERLRALKTAQELLNTPDDNAPTPNEQPQEQLEQEKEDEDEDDNEDSEENNVNMKFRNYLPHDKQLQEGKLAPPVLPKFEDPAFAIPPPVDENKEDPFLNIAPKKPNWDLRRDVQKRLDKLDRRTQKSMLTLMEQEEAKRSSEENKENGGAN
ncbi:hypothetical protein ACP275_04G186300 [Erythranthe tilingii]